MNHSCNNIMNMDVKNKHKKYKVSIACAYIRDLNIHVRPSSGLNAYIFV